MDGSGIVIRDGQTMSGELIGGVARACARLRYSSEGGYLHPGTLFPLSETYLARSRGILTFSCLRLTQWLWILRTRGVKIGALWRRLSPCPFVLILKGCVA
jgi:hypothetical protein